MTSNTTSETPRCDEAFMPLVGSMADWFVVAEAAIKLARQLERELHTRADKHGQYEAAYDEAETALREIAMLCGDPDPADGDDVGPNDVVDMVRGALASAMRGQQ